MRLKHSKKGRSVHQYGRNSNEIILTIILLHYYTCRTMAMHTLEIAALDWRDPGGECNEGAHSVLSLLLHRERSLHAKSLFDISVTSRPSSPTPVRARSSSLYQCYPRNVTESFDATKCTYVFIEKQVSFTCVSTCVQIKSSFTIVYPIVVEVFRFLLFFFLLFWNKDYYDNFKFNGGCFVKLTVSLGEKKISNRAKST